MTVTANKRKVKCGICSNKFTATSPTSKYCKRCQPLAQSVEKAEMYRRYMSEGRKCLYCNKHFMPAVPDQRFCSEKCEHKRKTNVDKCNERRKKPVAAIDPLRASPKPKYKSPISDMEQERLNIEVKKKVSPKFDHGRKLSKSEIEAIKHTITPIEKIGHRSRPTYTYGAAFGGER